MRKTYRDDDFGVGEAAASPLDTADRLIRDLLVEEAEPGANPGAEAYNSEAHCRQFLKTAEPFSEKAIEYLKEIVGYIYDTYGRFPAHVDAWNLPGVWVQFSHLELEYYEKYFDPLQFARQAKHAEMWEHR